MLKAFVACYLPEDTTIRVCAGSACGSPWPCPAVLIGGALMGVILVYWIPMGLAWRMADTGSMDPAPPQVRPEPDIRDDHPLLVAARRGKASVNATPTPAPSPYAPQPSHRSDRARLTPKVGPSRAATGAATGGRPHRRRANRPVFEV